MKTQEESENRHSPWSMGPPYPAELEVSPSHRVRRVEDYKTPSSLWGGSTKAGHWPRATDRRRVGSEKSEMLACSRHKEGVQVPHHDTGLETRSLRKHADLNRRNGKLAQRNTSITQGTWNSCDALTVKAEKAHGEHATARQGSDGGIRTIYSTKGTGRRAP